VDEVWHQHLTYTRSYWVDLCQGVLGRELHHFPSAGGPEEDVKHREWYKATLRLYTATFDAEPPADIWPAQAPATVVPTPELPRFEWNSRNGLSSSLFFLSRFLVPTLSSGNGSKGRLKTS